MAGSLGHHEAGFLVLRPNKDGETDVRHGPLAIIDKGLCGCEPEGAADTAPRMKHTLRGPCMSGSIFMPPAASWLNNVVARAPRTVCCATGDGRLPDGRRAWSIALAPLEVVPAIDPSPSHAAIEDGGWNTTGTRSGGAPAIALSALVGRLDMNREVQLDIGETKR